MPATTVTIAHTAITAANFPEAYEIISPVITNIGGDTASFATASTRDGNLGTYTIHSVFSVVIDGPEAGYLMLNDGCENVSRAFALAVIAERQHRAEVYARRNA